MKPESKLTKVVSFAGLGILIATLFVSAAIAQNSGAGTITGTVTDPTGSVVPGAAVAVRNTNTGATLALTTNGAGIYVAPFLPPGAYEITASKAGFGKIVRTDLTLQVGQTLTIDIALPLQTTRETVTVSGQPPVVDTQKTDMSQVVSAAQQENLPLAGRRWESFALLTPNVTTDGGTGLISYRGISGLYNSSAVDGTNNSQAFFSETKGRTTIPYIYSMDSIQEFQVASSNYSAELGQAAGGIVNAVTKSGTNTMHGDLFYYLRYPSLNALDPLQKAKGIYTQPIHQQQQFGGSVGGPMIKDKLFYFFTYDGSRKVNPISYTSNASFPIACTYSLITPAQCAAANRYFSGLLGAYPRFQNQDVGFGKLDYLFNPANRVSASFNLDNFKSPNSYNSATTSNANSNTANGTAVTRERIFVANWDSTFNPTTINNFRFQWSQDLEIISANGTAPSVTVNSGTTMAYGMPNALPRPAFPNEHRLQFADVLSKTAGKHAFKAGIDFNAIHELLINLFQGGGVYGYTGNVTDSFSNWVADVMGINVGDGKTGRHYNSFVQVTDPVTGVGKDDFYNYDWAGFAEDSWKVLPNLTLNLGVRYDLFLIPQPPKPNTSTPLTTLYTSTINIPKNQFAPRIGAAWEVRKGTVVRLGYGIFYGKTSNSTYYATRVENGEFQQTYNCAPANPAIPCAGLTFPNVIFAPPGGTPVAPFPGALTPRVTPITLSSNTSTTRGQDPNWKNPLVHEGEVTVEQQLPGNVGVSASYVFSRALHLPVFTDANLAPTSATKTYTYPGSSMPLGPPSFFTVPFYTSANRVDPTGAILTGRSVVNSLYNSFVLTVRKRMAHGVEFVANYTLSKAEDDGQVMGQFGTFNGTDYTIDPYNQKAMWGLSDLDQRQRLVANVIWKPEFASHWSNRAARMIVNGYTLSSIFSIASGQPVTGLISGTPPGVIDGGLTGGMVNNSGTAPFTYEDPSVPRNFYDGPGFWDIDARVSREFRIKERYRLSFLVEAFNLLNHTNVFGVNTTQYSLAFGTTTLSRSATFLAPTATNNGLYGARQLQISGRFTF